MTDYIAVLQIVQFEQRIHRLQQQLKEVRQAGIGATAEGSSGYLISNLLVMDRREGIKNNSL